MSKRFTLLPTAIAVIASGTFAVAALSSSPGLFVVWGADTSPLVIQGAPSGSFVALAAGGGRQTLAIRADRTLELNPVSDGPMPPIPAGLSNSEFCAVGNGRDHALAIRTDGTIVAWPLLTAFPLAVSDHPPTTARFVEVTGAGGFYSVALDTAGNIVMWGGSRLSTADAARTIAVGAPMGRFKAIAARGRYTLALAEDGNIYGWGTGSISGVDFGVFTGTSTSAPWTPDGMTPDGRPRHYIAPMEAGHPYTAIAAGLDVILALRADGTVMQWATDPPPVVPPASAPPRMPSPPPSIVFKQIAAGGLGLAAGIDETGRIHAWGTQPWINTVSPGVYSALSAAVSHIAAIEAPRHFLWPPNHEMQSIALTFRADDNCTPVALSGLSLELRSNQPDNGSGSGNTTGDTNGEDGYTSPVVLPANAISQNIDGSFTATFELRAERAGEWPESRIYTAAIVSTDTASPPNASTRMVAQIRVEHGGQ